MTNNSKVKTNGIIYAKTAKDNKIKANSKQRQSLDCSSVTLMLCHSITM